MLRNVFIVLVLAALAATSPAASPVVPANARKLAHHKSVHATARAAHRAAARPTGHATAHRTGRTVTSSRASSRRHTGRNPGRARTSRSLRAPGHPTLRRASLVSRRVYMPPSPLKGSFESLARQNQRAEEDGLERILDEQDLA